MKVSFLVPFKPLNAGKSRLVADLPRESAREFRDQITRALMEDTVSVLDAFLEVKVNSNEFSCIVCSKDRIIGELLKEKSGTFHFLEEQLLYRNEEEGYKDHDFNHVISFMNDHAMEELDVDGTILLMGDLPLLIKEDLHELINSSIDFMRRQSPHSPRAVVISPSPGNGCNMLARFPPDFIPTNFSDTILPSYLANITIAKERLMQEGLEPNNFILPYISLPFYLDCDTMDDIANILPILKNRRPQSRLLATLKKWGVSIRKSGSGDNRKLRLAFS
ncbi:hypothetical protein GF325_08970 [Candidatus Bathyarchaeota archaeon]|nr:hypothetical protein [Candidatus Bathyarchaeota archaeon]